MGIKSFISNYFTKGEIRKLEREVDKIVELEPKFQAMSDDELKACSDELKSRARAGEDLDNLLYEAFALVRETSWRVIGLKPYKVQLLGGIVLHQGRIAEMRTGEGKTLVATMPSYLNALTGKGVHIVTVNDYLAQRDRDWMGKIHNFLGLSVGCITNSVESYDRKAEYDCDITYGTNNEFGFDYLRDNMVQYREKLVQRELNYAIVDEVDSILVDEARTPLIISGMGNKPTELYVKANLFVQDLTGVKELDIKEKKEKNLMNLAEVEEDKNEELYDYRIDEEHKTVALTKRGMQKAEEFFSIKIAREDDAISDSDEEIQIDEESSGENLEIMHHVSQALRAHYMMKKDVDYVSVDGEILIVDEFTGRIMHGRRYSNGLHQAIEVKENLEIQKESQTLATITLQNYFRLYNKISGMTGTAKTEEDEFKEIYNMDVVSIPTNKPIAREDLNDLILGSMKAKFDRVIDEIETRHKKNQPVLVGTITIEVSELLHNMLKRRGIKSEVLNAKQHQREAEIVAQAGRYGAVTIATNMAGRGTDIILGGNPEFMARNYMKKEGYSDEVIELVSAPLKVELTKENEEAYKKYSNALEEFKKETEEEAIKVKEAGGLHIIGTERHESRRIDNQLRGRAGRQGDAGSTQFFISLEDDLMRLFLPEAAKNLIERMGLADEVEIEAKLLNKSIENAQKNVESRNFSVRKHVLQYDDVMNKQRQIIYSERQRVLNGEDIKEHLLKMADSIVESTVNSFSGGASIYSNADTVAIKRNLNSVFYDGIANFDDEGELELSELISKVKTRFRERYSSIENNYNQEIEKMKGIAEANPNLEFDIPKSFREIERIALLNNVDSQWMEHIDAMDQLKQGISLRAVGQKDPVQAYQFEGFDMFDAMVERIAEGTVTYMFNKTNLGMSERIAAAIIMNETHGEQAQRRQASSRMGNVYVKRSDTQQPYVKEKEKLGPNDRCHCGSGKKYKRCCMRLDEQNELDKLKLTQNS